MSEQSRPVVFLHVGAPKTGTTYLQHVLWNNRAALRRDGVLYPGDAAPSHFWASLDLRETGFKGHRPDGVEGAWARLVDEVRSWRGTAVIDHETLARATPSQVDRAMRDLSFAEVHLVFTARDMARQLPAAWQERMKNRETVTYTDFLARVGAEGGRDRLARQFFASHSAPGVLARWAHDLPPERVHVVTVPPSGAEPGLLWRRFAGLVGLDPSRYDTEAPASNSSVGAAEAAVLRLLNLELGDDVPWPDYAARVKFHLAPALGARGGDRIGLPEDAYAWAVDWSRQAVADLSAAGYDVVGDLDELVPSTRPSGANPDEVPLEDQLGTAVAAAACLLRRPEKDGGGASRPRARQRLRRLTASARGRGWWADSARRASRRLRRRVR